MSFNALPLVLAQADPQAAQVTLPSYFVPIFFVLLIAGLLGCLVAAVLGFGRARAHGPHARWFALSAVCLLIYHLHFLATGFAGLKGDAGLAFPLVTTLNLFIVLAALCAIIGFIKMKSVSPAIEPEDLTTDSE
ncbi:MAG: hypothetical protein JO360_08645 [Acidobacteria bacterium]|nr:hypothetical protein [Acidobacteriota bacterium]